MSQLPEWIGQLTNLVRVDLQQNRLSQLPRSMSQLANLRQLNVSGNQLSQLPESVRQLTNLTALSLDNNPLPEQLLDAVRAHPVAGLHRWLAGQPDVEL